MSSCGCNSCKKHHDFRCGCGCRDFRHGFGHGFGHDFRNFDRLQSFSHHQHHNHVCGCGNRHHPTCSHPIIFDRRFVVDDCHICDNRFSFRLSGLRGGMAFRLRQLIGCEVKLGISCGEECEEIKAVVCFVGTDFVEVDIVKEEKVNNKKKKIEKTRILPFESIEWIETKAKDCDC